MERCSSTGIGARQPVGTSGGVGESVSETPPRGTAASRSAWARLTHLRGAHRKVRRLEPLLRERVGEVAHGAQRMGELCALDLHRPQGGNDREEREERDRRRQRIAQARVGFEGRWLGRLRRTAQPNDPKQGPGPSLQGSTRSPSVNSM